MNEVCVFPDTNLFLHCRALHDLPWHELFDSDALHLKIATTVVDEIDRLKRDGNPKRAKRAREANALFRQLLTSPAGSVDLPTRGKPLRVSFAPALPASRITPDTLDRLRGDDSLIEEVLRFSKEHSSTVLLTADTGVDLRAQRHGVKSRAIPDSWLLPPEPDERDKRIRELERRVDQMEDRAPQLQLAVLHDEAVVDTLTLALPLYSDLTTIELDMLTAEVRRRHPIATEFLEPPLSVVPQSELERHFLSSIKRESVSKSEIEEYLEEYSAWERKVHERLARWANILNLKHRWCELRILLENVGAASADHLLLEIFLYGGAKAHVTMDPDERPRMHKFGQLLSDTPDLPPPPPAPRAMTSWEKTFDGLRDSMNFDSRIFAPPYLPSIPAGRDRHALYVREDDEALLEAWSLECEEFRHGLEPRDIRCWLWVPRDAKAEDLKLRMRATAKNLPTSVESFLSIVLSNQPRQTIDLAKQFTVNAPTKPIDKDTG